MSEPLVTEKHRIDRRYFDHATGRAYRRLRDIPGRRVLDERVLPVLMRIGYVPGNATLFEGVDCLPGGCEVQVGSNGWALQSRFRFAESPAARQRAGASPADLNRKTCGSERWSRASRSQSPAVALITVSTSMGDLTTSCNRRFLF